MTTTRHYYDDGEVEISIEEFAGEPTPGIAVIIGGITVTITRQVMLLPNSDDTTEEKAITVWIDTDEAPTAEVLRVRLNESELHN